jgi:sec-independent protein translocase protein TatA
MIGFDIGGPEAIIVLVIVLVLFGGSQIPKLARNLGRAQKEFKDGIDEGQRSASSVTDTTGSSAPTPNTPTSNTPDSSGQPSS